MRQSDSAHPRPWEVGKDVTVTAPGGVLAVIARPVQHPAWLRLNRCTDDDWTPRPAGQVR